MSPPALLVRGGDGALTGTGFAALTEGGQPLRTVVLPADLMGYFTSIAYENTERGIETCGLLMGTLVRRLRLPSPFARALS